MKTKEQLFRKLNKKMDSYNRKAEKHDYPKVSFDIENCFIKTHGDMITAGGNPKSILGIIYYIFPFLLSIYASFN